MATRTHGDLIGVHVQPDRRPGRRLRPSSLDRAPRAARGPRRGVPRGGRRRRRQRAHRLRARRERHPARAGRQRTIAVGRAGQRLGDQRRPAPARGIDVHVISVSEATIEPTAGRRGRRRAPAAPRRVAPPPTDRLAGSSCARRPAAHARRSPTCRDTLSLPSDLLLYLLLVVVAAAVGGVGPAVAAAVGGFLCANWFFTPPYHRLTIADGENALALVIFLVVGALVSFLVLQASAHAAETTAVPGRGRGAAGGIGPRAAEPPRSAAAEALLLRPGRRAAGVAAPRGVPRPAHAARVDQGVGHQPPAARRRLDGGGDAGVPRTIDEESDRLDDLVGNLLDLSRLQSGALRFQARPVGYEEVVPAALASLSGPTDGVDIHLDETLPRVQADPALLERVVANLAANAIAASHPSRPVRIEAGAVGDRVDLRIVDRGPRHPGGRSGAHLRAVPAAG